MKQISLKLSEELHAAIKEAAMVKYPQFTRPVTAWIRETLEREAQKELKNVSSTTKSS